MTKTNLSSGLRNRLLFSLIGLACAISIIFISVAFNLSRDLGESLELDHSNKIFSQLTHHTKGLIKKSTVNELTLKKILKSELQDLLGDSTVGVEVWINKKHFILKTSQDYTDNSDISQATNTKKSSYGFIENETSRYIWVYEHLPINHLSILMVRRTYALDKAISYVSNRLFITALLTFWLAMWVALFLSALVTKRFEQSNEQLKYLATHDVLTGLSNRAYLYQHAQYYLNPKNINKYDRSNTLLAVYIIDIDKFKDINDTMGHLAGDELLKTISIRLSNLKNKNSKVVRYGGDEFVILCDDLSESDSIALAEEIVTSCRQPISINNYAFETSASIGVSYYPKHGLHFDNLIKHADIAMYQAKIHRLGFQVFQQEFFTRSEFRVNLRGQLNAALEQGQFILYYQPKVQLPSGNTVGVEALVRWAHPKEGLLMPDMFIDIIEQSVFVHDFTRYVLLQAITQCRIWLDNDIELSIAVNISPYNLMDPGLVSYLSDQLKHHEVPAELIEIELTETSSMVNIEKTQEIFSQLKAIGVKLSIDDFGTGMSSLAYVKQLDVDYIKIDRSFVTGIADNEKDEAVIISMLVLCQKLKKLTIAEGVETAEQANKLASLGCNFAQGYLYSKPLPVDDVTELLNNKRALHD
jgi:diguanylate cyclase (GGDEF)-like protein